jgi:hypothetical protein
MQQLVAFALLMSSKIFRTVVKQNLGLLSTKKGVHLRLNVRPAF